MRAVFCGSGIKVPSDALSVSLCPHQPSSAMPWGPEPQTGRAPNLDLYCTCMWVHKRSSATRVFGGLTRVWHIRGRQVRVLFPDRRHGQGACRTPTPMPERRRFFSCVRACSAAAAPRAFLCISGISVVSFLRVAQKHLPPHHLLLPLGAGTVSFFVFFLLSLLEAAKAPSHADDERYWQRAAAREKSSTGPQDSSSSALACLGSTLSCRTGGQEGPRK